jgi:ribosome-binding factor A
MRPYRNLKMGSLIEHELSQMILEECEIDNALVTITSVQVSEDLLQAKVMLSIIPYEKELEAYFAIEEKKKQLEHQLLKKMKIRSVPHLKFEIESHKREDGEVA